MIRSLVYGLPALLLIGVALASVSLLSTKKTNEMSIGTLGEPSTLNQIQQADAATGEMQAIIFNGLLKYDVHRKITTDLAKSFVLSQTTTVFSGTPTPPSTRCSSWKRKSPVGRTGN